MKIKHLPKSFILLLLYSILSLSNCGLAKEETPQRPNILFCIADDWGWPHAGAYGDQVVKTPTFDKLARNGVLFDNAYVSSPSCTPSRNAILTGQYHWRLGEGASLWSTLDVKIPVYPLLLEQAGYHIGHWRKAWGPGNLEAGGYVNSKPQGATYQEGFEQFLEARPEDAPFSFWLGASDPHRPYEKGIGKANGIPIDKIQVPDFYPDEEVIRSDIADYYFEVERFDNDVAEAIKLLEERGELENTIIVMTGDHGMPFPRCKGNLYDYGVKVPLVIQWASAVAGNRLVEDFVSLTDLAATFLDVAGLDIPEKMTGKSLKSLLLAEEVAKVEEGREYVIFGRERHTPAQLAPSIAGYPSRGIRTDQYLYIRNLFPERWPAGVPEGASHPMSSFADCDNGPTKSRIMEVENEAGLEQYYDLNFGRRPAEELYDVKLDPFQVNNIAIDSEYYEVKNELSKKLDELLVESKDPRMVGGVDFDTLPYRSSYKLSSGKK